MHAQSMSYTQWDNITLLAISALLLFGSFLKSGILEDPAMERDMNKTVLHAADQPDSTAERYLCCTYIGY